MRNRFDQLGKLLLNLSHALGKKPSRTPEEQEFIVRTLGTWEQAREMGRAEEAAQALLTVLRVRGIEVPDEVCARFLAQKKPDRLERWLERAVVASSIDEVLRKRR